MFGVPQTSPVEGLPTEILVKILRLLDETTLFNVSHTCRLWNQICLGDSLLRQKVFEVLNNMKIIRHNLRYNPNSYEIKVRETFMLCNCKIICTQILEAALQEDIRKHCKRKRNDDYKFVCKKMRI